MDKAFLQGWAVSAFCAAVAGGALVAMGEPARVTISFMVGAVAIGYPLGYGIARSKAFEADNKPDQKTEGPNPEV
ncbi:MAG: hypothetical protein LRZ85_10015 [Alphaproteobacteria bacterium]|nr:hypothetical protein [Alphaproteobacteria bacterium]MCD8526276.1 hypothetical protein [Alphaproteobacteria bacterium]MCD8571122.1 hypothetical protein [Alphaproteobacteria bacterium]